MKQMGRISFNRLKYIFLGTLIIAQVLIAAFPLSSVGAVYETDSINDRLTKYALASMLYECSQTDSGGGGYKASLHEGNDKILGKNLFFGANTHAGTLIPTPLDSYTREGDLKIGCGEGDNALSEAFFETFDIDPIQFVCDAGYTRKDGYKPCTGSSADFNANRDGFKSSIKKNTGIDLDNPGADVKFNYALTTYIAGCGADKKTLSEYNANQSISKMHKFQIASSSSYKLVDAYYLVKHDQINGSKETEDYVLDGELKRNTSCKDITQIISGFAAEYRLWIAKSVVCSDENGITSRALLIVCADGLENKGTSSYCYNRSLIYDNASRTSNFAESIYIACAVGQQQPVKKGTNDPVGLICYREFKDDENAAAHINACTSGAVTKSCPTPTSVEAGLVYQSCVWGKDNIDAESRYVIGDFDDTISDACIEGSGDCEEVPTTCAIEGVGWIICPAINFMATILDYSFTFLADSFLSTNIKILQDTNLETAWGMMRSVANVMFVIAFLAIIYSQLTGGGIGNYGVKRMLPRIIIAAILVNISLIICQLAVDISNILGYSLKGVFDGIQTQISADNQINTTGGAGNTGLEIAGQVIGWLALAGGAAMLIMSITGPVILAAVLAVLMIVLMLFARTALIVILTIVAPLAFVAYLLPNTEKWFKKWYQLFFTLLLLFPLVAVVFGASALTASILNGIGSTQGSDGWMIQVTALGVATIPFFMVPALLKSSLNGIGTIGAKLSGFANKQGAKASGGSRGKLSERYGRSRMAQAGNHMKYRGNMRRAQRRANSKIAGAVDNSAIGRALGFDRGANAAAAAVTTDYNKSVDDAEARMANLSNKHLVDNIINNTKVPAHEREAARRKLLTSGGFKEKAEALASIDGDHVTDRERAAMNKQYYSSGLNNYYGNKLGDKILDPKKNGAIGGKAGLDQEMRNNAGAISAQTVATSGLQALEEIERVFNTSVNGVPNPTTAAQKALLKDTYNVVHGSPELTGQIQGASANQQFQSTRTSL